MNADSPDIVDRLNAVSGNLSAHQFELILLVPAAASTITDLRHQLDAAIERNNLANYRADCAEAEVERLRAIEQKDVQR